MAVFDYSAQTMNVNFYAPGTGGATNSYIFTSSDTACVTNVNIQYQYGQYGQQIYGQQICGYATVSVSGLGNCCYAETAEQQAARELAEERQKKAEARAEELLLMCLPDSEREQYLKHGYIEINVDTRRYRIKKGWIKNVERLGVDGKPDELFCIQPEILVPHADNMLAQKLLLQTDEAQFLKIANRFPVS